MKKALLIIFLLFVFVKTPVFAADNVATDPSKLDLSPTPVQYELPYPGVLPDNPLYFLKAIRDRVVSILINDPLKKAEFALLTSDKRMNAGLFLVNKGKDALGTSTITKGNNYFFQALTDIKKAKTEGKDTRPLLEKMDASSKKHTELLTGIKSKIGNPYKKELDQEIKKTDNFEKEVSSLLMIE